MNNPIISVIAAYSEDGGYGIGKDKMPWPLGGIPGDLTYFKKHTTDAPDGHVNVLVCGRQTFLSMGNVHLGEKRVLVGISKTIRDPGPGYGPNRHILGSIGDAFRLA